MRTLKRLELTCPNCDCRFSSVEFDAPSAGETMPRRTDFQPREDTLQILPFGVHLCERCGYAGPTDWFTDRADVSFEVRCRVWDELAPLVATRSLDACERYEFAARVAFWAGASPRDVAELWLRAAWCCVDAGDTEAERFYRRHAVWSFEDCFNEEDCLAPDERGPVCYLIGELWRRVGDETLAREWFNRVNVELSDRSRQRWLARWASQQRDDPREWFV